ncbi:MAG: AbrB/MazE/SpoVT family DNA-binding domain-containing protein [Candidatus Diapherotrites archaeon]
MVENRKIQLVGNSTYTISLPKQWIEKNKLKEKNTLEIEENPDGSLLINVGKQKQNFSEMNLNSDYYKENLGEILLAIYYLGTDTIRVYSKNNLSKEAKAKIRKAMQNMSGTVISQEDDKEIIIKVLLEKSKVEIKQILFRLCTLIDNSLNALQEKPNKEEIQLNENEIDRLYHLGVKTLTISLINNQFLITSGIKNATLIPSYFFILKRLEHIGDEIQALSKSTYYKKEKSKENSEILNLLRKKIKEIHFTLKNEETKLNNNEWIEEIETNLNKINTLTQNHYRQIIRFLKDMQEEIIYLKYYKELIKET